MNNFVFLFVIALCGTHITSLNVERTNRIAGGSPATDTQFLYMISLQEKRLSSEDTRGHICGGALFTLRHAVTSASCVHVNRNGQYVVIDPTEYRVFAGAAVLTNDTSADRHRDVERFTVHPDYRRNTYLNDIAVITLASEFPSRAVSPVALAVSDPNPTQVTACEASGWGTQNASGTPSTQLMHVKKIVFGQLQCKALYNASLEIIGQPQINIEDTMICATNPDTSSCQGDLGNPLVCNSNLNGILIAHRNECSGEINPIPEVYTRISSYSPWLLTTAGASTFKPGMAMLGLICIVQIVTNKVL